MEPFPQLPISLPPEKQRKHLLLLVTSLSRLEEKIEEFSLMNTWFLSLHVQKRKLGHLVVSWCGGQI